MKKLFMGLSLAALLAGCASQDSGMGGTSDETTRTTDQSFKTDSIHNSSDQYNNNATRGTGTSTATNNATGESMP